MLLEMKTRLMRNIFYQFCAAMQVLRLRNQDISLSIDKSNLPFILLFQKPGFHIIVTIVWIAVNDSSVHSDPSDLLETCTNDPNHRKDQDGWDRALLYTSDPLAPCRELSRQISW